MKKDFLSSFVLMICILFCGIAFAQMAPGTTQVTITNSSLDYSWTVPVKTAAVTIKSRSLADFKISSAAGTAAGGSNYITIPAGMSYSESSIWSNGGTIYLSSANAGQVIEIIYWQSQ